jgi:protein-S-isoprenylcysteine O-methyltransferase Ste14
MQATTLDKPGVVAPPPLIYLVPLGLALLAEWALPALRIPVSVPPVAGGSLIGLGGLLMVAAVRAMRRARTATSPYKPSTAVVSNGPYRFSRNPIYLAYTLTYLGVALLIGSLLALLLLPAVLAVVQVGVIRREERYLEEKFGEDYRRYKSGVRRWL